MKRNTRHPKMENENLWVCECRRMKTRPERKQNTKFSKSNGRTVKECYNKSITPKKDIRRIRSRTIKFAYLSNIHSLYKHCLYYNYKLYFVLFLPLLASSLASFHPFFLSFITHFAHSLCISLIFASLPILFLSLCSAWKTFGTQTEILLWIRISLRTALPWRDF